MNAFELMAAIEAIQKAKADLPEAIQKAKAGEVDEEFLGALAVLAAECADYHALYEKESQELPKLQGAKW